MPPSQREWRIGPHLLWFESPDILRVEFKGSLGLHDAVRMVDLYRELAAAGPFFVLGDMQEAGALEADARHYISEHVHPEWFLGTVYIHARLLHKAVIKGIVLAAQLLGRAEPRDMANIHFASTAQQAHELIGTLRSQHEAKVA